MTVRVLLSTPITAFEYPKGIHHFTGYFLDVELGDGKVLTLARSDAPNWLYNLKFSVSRGTDVEPFLLQLSQPKSTGFARVYNTDFEYFGRDGSLLVKASGYMAMFSVRQEGEYLSETFKEIDSHT